MKENAQPRPDGTHLLRQLFWVSRLHGHLPETTLSECRARPPVQGRGLFEAHRFEVPAGVSEKLLRLTKNSNLSIYLVLASALAILLYRYTGNEHLLINSPPYAPTVPDRDAVLVPLRLQAKGGTGFKAHLLEVRGRVLEAYSNQDYPFESLPDLLPAAGANARPIPARITMSLQNIHGQRHEPLPGSELLLSFKVEGGSISGSALYEADLFDAPTIERITGHYVNILDGVLRDVHVRIDDVRMSAAWEEHQCLFEFNRREGDSLSNRSVQQIFEEQAERWPERVAVVAADRTHTYRELSARVDRLAHRLQELGVGPEVVVSVLAPRGAELLIAMLALFKVGGVYLPLDPRQPPRRLSQIISRSRSALLLTDDEARAKAASEGLPPAGRPAIATIREPPAREHPGADLRHSPQPVNLAYLIYTSGSTGVPKGAMVEHGGMLNHLRAKISDFQLGSADVLAQTAPQSFDISIWQLLAALLVGGSVNVATDEVVRDASLLLDWLEREAVSVLEVVPSQLRAMLQTIGVSGADRWKLPALRWLFVTGEALPPELSRRWLGRYPKTPLVNAYGPTECSDDVTHYMIRAPPPEGSFATPIGRPIANTQIYILDRRFSPLPVGVAGEVFVGGSGVGRGYFDEPARTAEVFVPNPFAAEAGGRLYRTGDLAFYLSDGNIQFLNRIDYQVKVRGFRIETGEIEAALTEHVAVREAVVVAVEEVSGDKRLVAYLVAEHGRELTIAELRGFLQSRLPEYMIPSAFVTLGRLPRGPNGKVERRALPLPEQYRREGAETFVPPRTPVEVALADIWEGALRGGRVGVHDNFFELGGDSLLAIQVINQIRASLGIGLPMHALFESPTLGDFAARVGQQLASEMSEPAVVEEASG